MKRNDWRNLKKMIALLGLSVLLLFGTACGGEEPNSAENPENASQAEDAAEISADQAASETALNLIRALTEADEIGAGTEWSIMAIARSPEANTDAALDLFTEYDQSIRVLTKRTEGILEEDRPTSNARAALALYMTGRDPAKVEGYDLLKRLEDVKAAREQGINAEIWALTASAVCGRPLKCAGKYIDDICSMAGEDGGITYDGATSDADITAMAIQALALQDTKSDQRDKISKTIENARSWLADQQGADGGYGNAETTAQVILALSCLGEDPARADGFSKEGMTLYDGLMQYRLQDGFSHSGEDSADLMATEQALCALDAIVNAQTGEGFFR